MFYFLMVLTLVITIIFMIVMWRAVLSSYSHTTMKKTKGRVKRISNEIDISDVSKRNSIILQATKVFTCIPFVKFSEESREEITRLISGANEKHGNYLILPEEIFVKDCLCRFFYFLGCLVFSMIWKPLICLIVLVPFVPSLPKKKLRDKGNSTLENILNQWPDFYSFYYSNYMQESNDLRLEEVCDTFMSFANPDMRSFLMRFKADLESGENFALDQLAKRYPDVVKIKDFCTYAQLRLAGDQASLSLLRGYKDDLDREIKEEREKDLKNRVKKANMAISVVVGIIVFLVCVFYFISTYAIGGLN